MSIAMAGHMGLKQETSFGTEATVDVFGEVSNVNLSSDNALHIPRLIGGIRGNKRILPANITAGGNFNYLLFPQDLTGWIMKGIFGQVTTTDLGNGAYQHVFTPIVTAALPSFTIQKDSEAGVFNYLGCVMGGFSMGITPDAIMEMAVEVTAQTVKEATIQTPSYGTLDPFLPFHAAVTLNSASNVDFEDLTIDITNALEPVMTLNNQRYVGKIVAKQFDCSGNFSLEFGNMDIMRLIWGDAAATAPRDYVKVLDLTYNLVMEDAYDATYGIIGTSAYHYRCQFDFHEVVLRGGEPDLTGADDRIKQDVEFVTRYSTADTAMMTVTLVNGESGYPDP